MSLQKILNKVLNTNILQFSLFVIFGAVIGGILQYEMVSDFYNYHYFVPWAFFHNRTFTDIAVALENSYHNPLVEIPSYFIVNYFNDRPFVLHAVNGCFFGILLFVFYKLISLIFNQKKRLSKIQIFITMFLVLGGFSLVAQIGSSSHEITVSIGIFAALYILYREIFILKKERVIMFFSAGIILGAMLGLKLTTITYCIAAGGALITFYQLFKHPVKVIGLFALGGFLGFCLTHGYWSYILYKNLDNPIFPYMNNVFKSPYYEETFISYNIYKKDFIDYLLFPFLASFQGNNIITAEIDMTDARLALGYSLLIICFCTALFKGDLLKKIKNNKDTVFLIVFTLYAYILWLLLFAIIRYAIPIEMLVSVFIVKYFSSIKTKTSLGLIVYSSICLILFFVLFSEVPHYHSWGSHRNLTKIVNFEKVNLPPHTLLLAISPKVGLPITQIVNDNPTTMVVNEASNLTTPGLPFYDKIKEYKAKSKYTAYIFLLTSILSEFDRNTPMYAIKQNAEKDVFSNLEFILKNEIGIENFYCRAINLDNFLSRSFVCIDKKDKEKVFPNLMKKKNFDTQSILLRKQSIINKQLRKK